MRISGAGSVAVRLWLRVAMAWDARTREGEKKKKELRGDAREKCLKRLGPRAV